MSDRAYHYREAERLMQQYHDFREAHKGAMFVMTPLELSEALVHATLAKAPREVEAAAMSRDARIAERAELAEFPPADAYQRGGGYRGP